MKKKVRCFSIHTDYDGDEVSTLKEALMDFGLYVYVGELEAQSASNGPSGDVIVSDKNLTDEEIKEIREFWPPYHDWSKPFDGPNKNNDVG